MLLTLLTDEFKPTRTESSYEKCSQYNLPQEDHFILLLSCEWPQALPVCSVSMIRGRKDELFFRSTLNSLGQITVSSKTWGGMFGLHQIGSLAD